MEGTIEHVDVLIVGAGISGIGAACHLQTSARARTYAILEGRDAIGGTWDLFRYPGIRSDSDMHTLGFGFKPWTRGQGDRRRPVDPGATSARRVAENGIDRHIRFGHRRRPRRVVERRRRAGPCEVDARDGGERCLHLQLPVMCAGYYSYADGYTPEFAGSSASRATSSIRSSGPRTSTTPASASW